MNTASLEQSDSPVRAFPTPETNLYKLIADPEYRKTFHARVKSGNRMMAPLYKMRILPLFGLGKQIMLLTTRGRVSKALRDTPIGYFRIDGIIHVFSGWGKAANWYKNMMACPEEVFLQVGFQRFRARPEVVEVPQEVEQANRKLVMQDPGGAHSLMGWDPKIDRLEKADFSMMVEKVLVVRFYPVTQENR
jgi:deazaflavin-dependent oxidoreductase (nitroreductase family)